MNIQMQIYDERCVTDKRRQPLLKVRFQVNMKMVAWSKRKVFLLLRLATGHNTSARLCTIQDGTIQTLGKMSQISPTKTSISSLNLPH